MVANTWNSKGNFSSKLCEVWGVRPYQGRAIQMMTSLLGNHCNVLNTKWWWQPSPSQPNTSHQHLVLQSIPCVPDMALTHHVKKYITVIMATLVVNLTSHVTTGQSDSLNTVIWHNVNLFNSYVWFCEMAIILSNLKAYCLQSWLLHLGIHLLVQRCSLKSPDLPLAGHSAHIQTPTIQGVVWYACLELGGSL